MTTDLNITVYAWDGVDMEDLSALYDLYKADGTYYYKGEAIISPWYREELVVNMEFKGQSPTSIRPATINAQGWERSSTAYFDEMLKNHPEYFSEKNVDLIKVKRKSPIIDETFVEFFPEYEAFIDQKLVHHHIGEDGQAVAVPEGAHSGHGGLHNIEDILGVTSNAERNSLKCQEAFDAGQAVNWNTFEHIQSLKTNAELLNEFPEWQKYSGNTTKLHELKEVELSTRSSRMAIESGTGTIEDYIKIRDNPDLSDYKSRLNMISDTELSAKYKFLEGCTDGETFDLFRTLEYRISKGANPASIILGDTIKEFKSNNYLLFKDMKDLRVDDFLEYAKHQYGIHSADDAAKAISKQSTKVKLTSSLRTAGNVAATALEVYLLVDFISTMADGLENGTLDPRDVGEESAAYIASAGAGWLTSSVAASFFTVALPLVGVTGPLGAVAVFVFALGAGVAGSKFGDWLARTLYDPAYDTAWGIMDMIGSNFNEFHLVDGTDDQNIMDFSNGKITSGILTYDVKYSLVVDSYGGDDSIIGYIYDDTLNGGTGNDEIHGGDGGDDIYGNEGHDKLYGDSGNDWIHGGSGIDIIYGGDGNDIINGDEEEDLLYGEDGEDTIKGGSGADEIYGGAGNDNLYGDDDDDLVLGAVAMIILMAETVMTFYLVMVVMILLLVVKVLILFSAEVEMINFTVMRKVKIQIQLITMILFMVETEMTLFMVEAGMIFSLEKLEMTPFMVMMEMTF
jgi:hypothetical protein